MGGCQSGRMSTIGNRVCAKSVPRVRIPPRPLKFLQVKHLRGFFVSRGSFKKGRKMRVLWGQHQKVWER